MCKSFGDSYVFASKFFHKKSIKKQKLTPKNHCLELVWIDFVRVIGNPILQGIQAEFCKEHLTGGIPVTWLGGHYAKQNGWVCTTLVE
jgi:hypothetical protein